MQYEKPVLEGPMDLYETPLLVNVDQTTAGIEIGDIGCMTGGSGCDATAVAT